MRNIRNQLRILTPIDTYLTKFPIPLVNFDDLNSHEVHITHMNDGSFTLTCSVCVRVHVRACVCLAEGTYHLHRA